MKKPLVSCICITQNRRLFLRKAIEYYMRAEKYSQLECELIIIDGSSEFNNDVASIDDDILYIHKPSKPHSLQGSNHNLACGIAKGEIIIKWDDDDWQAQNRIWKQVAELNAMMMPGFVFTSQYYGYHLVERKAFRSRCWNDKASGSLGGTFAFHKKTWEKVPFRDVDQAEDAGFFEDIQRANITMIDMQDPNFFIYIRHNQNGSPHHNDNYDDVATENVVSLLDYNKDTNFYNELSEILPLAQWNHPTTFGQYGLYNRNIKSPLFFQDNSNQLSKSVDKK